MAEVKKVGQKPAITKPAPKAVVEIEEDIDLDDLEVGDIEVTEEVEEEADAVEEEIAEAAAKDKQKAKKQRKAGSGLASTQPLAEDEVGASYVAELCGVEPRELRGFLRKHYRNMEECKSQRYRWKKNDPQIQEIVDAFKKAKSAPKKTKKAAEEDDE